MTGLSKWTTNNQAYIRAFLTTEAVAVCVLHLQIGDKICI